MQRIDRVIAGARRLPPIATDASMGAIILALGLVELALGGEFSGPQRVAFLMIVFAGSLGVALRRVNLVAGCILVVLASVGGMIAPAGYNSTYLPELILLYTVSDRCGL